MDESNPNLRNEGRVLRFPGIQQGSETARAKIGPLDVVLCGTFRKDHRGLQDAFAQLRELGCRILSPGNTEMEIDHLEAIQRAHFIWLHAPQGYVGSTAALEVGFAQACRIPIFSATAPHDEVLRKIVRVVASPQDALSRFIEEFNPPPVPAL